MVVSYDLLYELEAVLLRPYFLRKLTVSDVLEYVLWIREGSVLAKAPEDAVVEGSPDPDDDYLLALAMVLGLDVVSGNRHLLEGGPFLVHAGDPYYPRRAGRVRVLSPRGFWEEALRPVR